MAERRYQMVFFGAVVVALGATYGVYNTLQRTKAESRVAAVPVVIAGQDFPEGARIERVALSTASWPAGTAPVGAFSVPDSVVGRVTRVAVFKGEPIVPGRLAPVGTSPGLEVKITPGKRAMAVKINDVVGLAGLIQPNSRVDVLVTLKEENQQTKQRAKVFMSNMRVLSVGTQVERGSDGKPIEATTAALEVTPDESERLAVAMNQGTIQLVLRGYGDPDSIKTRGATANDVLAQLSNGQIRPASDSAPRRAGIRRARTAPRPAPQQTAVTPPPLRPYQPDSMVVQVFRGNKLSQQKFGRPDAGGAPPTP